MPPSTSTRVPSLAVSSRQSPLSDWKTVELHRSTLLLGRSRVERGLVDARAPASIAPKPASFAHVKSPPGSGWAVRWMMPLDLGAR